MRLTYSLKNDISQLLTSKYFPGERLKVLFNNVVSEYLNLINPILENANPYCTMFTRRMELLDTDGSTTSFTNVYGYVPDSAEYIKIPMLRWLPDYISARKAIEFEGSNIRLIYNHPDMPDNINKAIEKVFEFEHERCMFSTSLSNIMRSVNTTAKLIELLPEAEPIINQLSSGSDDTEDGIDLFHRNIGLIKEAANG